jgi:hypothetical protein
MLSQNKCQILQYQKLEKILRVPPRFITNAKNMPSSKTTA